MASRLSREDVRDKTGEALIMMNRLPPVNGASGFKSARRHIRRIHLLLHAESPHEGATAAKYWPVHHLTGQQLIDRSAWDNPALSDPFGLGGCGVYVWHYYDEVQYVGRTDVCLQKRLDSTLYPHGVIDIDGNVHATDGLAFYECESEPARKFERILIDAFRPRFNRR